MTLQKYIMLSALNRMTRYIQQHSEYIWAVRTDLRIPARKRYLTLAPAYYLASLDGRPVITWAANRVLHAVVTMKKHHISRGADTQTNELAVIAVFHIGTNEWKTESLPC